MLKLILIDDDRFSLETLASLIPWNEFGFEIAGVFSNSSKAVQFIETTPPDCIITDIRMPEPDGLSIVKMCAEKHPDIKIILFSAYRDFEYAQSAIRYNNVYDYITKPIDYDLLQSALIKLAGSVAKKETVVNEHFQSDDNIELKLQIFSNLICGHINDNETLKKELKSISVDYDPETMSFSVINFHIPEFLTYLKTSWKHEMSRFYYALSNLVPFENDYAFFALALYSYGNISYIAIHKNSDISRCLENFITDFKNNCLQVLNLTITLNNYHTYKDLMEFNKSTLFYSEKNSIDKTIQTAIDYIKIHYSENITLEMISEHVYMSQSYFSTYFRQKTGKRFIDYLTSIRMEKATDFLLHHRDMTISEICEKVGYNHMGHFYKTFKKYYNVSPHEYRTEQNSDKR